MDVNAVIVTLFKPGAPDTVNSSLSSVDTARKCAFAMQEAAQLGIPTPKCLGFAIRDQTAAIVTEKLEQTAWHPRMRVAAARYLARLHVAKMHRLSPLLRHLVQQSDPKQQRTYLRLSGYVHMLDRHHPEWRSHYLDVADAVQDLVQAGPPAIKHRSLVHGDYCSANIIPAPDGIRIIDWETFALGDPMWDLAFLLGADRNLEHEEVEAVIEAYRAIAPVEMYSLTWHKQCWDIGWKLRDIAKRLQPGKD